MGASDGRCEINQILFAAVTELVADSRERLRILVSTFM